MCEGGVECNIILVASKNVFLAPMQSYTDATLILKVRLAVAVAVAALSVSTHKSRRMLAF